MKKLKPIFLSLFFAAAAILAAAFSAKADTLIDIEGSGGLQISDTAVSGTDYDYADGVLTIKSTKAVTISGGTKDNPIKGERIIVDNADGANITLSDVNIEVRYPASDKFAVFEISADTVGEVKVTLDGKSYLKSGSGCAGLQKTNDECTLIIRGNADGLGENEYNLEAIGGSDGAGIGGGTGHAGKNITIESGKIKASNDGGGAGIGGGEGGDGTDIKICGSADVTAIGAYGAGIGGGANKAGKDIEIYGNAKVNASTNSNGAGIGGGGYGDGTGIKIYGNAYVEATSNAGAGIGGGFNSKGSDITIDGNVTVKATGAQGAGIGGGAGGNGSITDGENITIKGGILIEATSSGGGAGIGGGVGGGNGKTIKISGGTVTAKSTANGAGIGGGLQGNGIDIEISGGKVTALCINANGAGIGGGVSGDGSDIKISGGEVTALCGRINEDGTITAGSNGAGIGGGLRSNNTGGNGSNIKISGGKVTAIGGTSGAGIGGGNGGEGSDIEISGGEVTAIGNVTALGNEGGAGIGGGANGNGTDITIKGNANVTSDSKRDANTHGTGAGIGGGSKGKGSDIKISGDANVKAESADGAGIGGGLDGDGSYITISGNANVTATGRNAAGIGGGRHGNGDNITIESCKKVVATSIQGGAGIGGGEDNNNQGKGIGTVITISGGEVEASGSSGGAGIGGGSGGNSSIISICGDATVTAVSSGSAGIGGGAMGNANDIKIYGSATVTATGSGGAGIGGGVRGTGTDIEIYDSATVKAIGNGGAGIGGGVYGDGKDIKISGGTVFAFGSNIGIGGQNNDATVYIKGTSSESYPWVFTNSISSANYDNRKNADDDGYWGIVFVCAEGDNFNDIEDNNFMEGIVYGTNQDVKITEDFTLTAGKTLTVLKDVTFKTNERLTLDDSVLYLNEGATLDKWYKTEKKNGGVIQHENSSPYKWYYADEQELHDGEALIDPDLWDEVSSLYINDETGREGIVLCDICGKPEPHNPDITDDWETTQTHHWHEGTCALGYDCAVERFKSEVTDCSYVNTLDSGAKVFDYGEHRYNDEPDEVKDGELYFYCIDCDYLIKMTIPTIYLNKVGIDGENNKPLADAEFGLYTNADCTGTPYMTGTTAIDTENGTAVVSFNTNKDDATKYIKRGETYYIKELKAPVGYTASDDVFKAAVDGDGKVTYGDDGDIEPPVCENKAIVPEPDPIIPDPVKIIKEDGEGKPLTGAIFGIYSDADCKNLITTATAAIDTDKDSDTYNKSVVVFNTELNTTYYIKETKAPDGYTASDDVFKAAVGEDGKVTYGDDGDIEPPVCENMAIVPEPTPSEPTTSEPTPSEPTTSEPTTSEPTPSEPTPSEPTTSEPTTFEPTTSEPTTSEPTPSEPTTSEPTTSEPTTSEPTPSEPTPSEPTTSEPTTSEPTPSEPTPSEPTPSEPTTFEPTPTEPGGIDNPNTGIGIGISGLTLLGGSLCATSVIKGVQRRKKK